MPHRFTILLFYPLRHAQIIRPHSRSATAIAYVANLSYLFTAQVPFIGNNRTAPIACLVLVARWYTKVTGFSHWPLAGRAFF